MREVCTGALGKSRREFVGLGVWVDLFVLLEIGGYGEFDLEVLKGVSSEESGVLE